MLATTRSRPPETLVCREVAAAAPLPVTTTDGNAPITLPRLPVVAATINGWTPDVRVAPVLLTLIIVLKEIVIVPLV